MEGYTNVLNEADVLRSNIRQKTTNVGPTKLFPLWFKVLSSLVSIVTEQKALLAIDKGASFIVDGFVNAKETRRVVKSPALKEIHGAWFFEHKSVDFVWV